MDEPRGLKELFQHVVKLAGKRVSDYKDLYDDWYKIMNMSPFEAVLEAWEHIKFEEPYEYFKLKTWSEQVDYLVDKVVEPEPKPEKTFKDAEMKAWSENLRAFQGGEISINQYLKTALETNQMSMAEVQKEVTRYEKHNYDMTKPINKTIGMSL